MKKIFVTAFAILAAICFTVNLGHAQVCDEFFTANAGPDQTVCGSSTILAGNDPTPGTGVWSITSGGSGSFAPSPADPRASFTGTAGRSYVLRWTTTCGTPPLNVDDVIITLVESPTIANAGDNQTVCDNEATLDGNMPTVGDGMWSIDRSFPPMSPGSFVSATDPMTIFRGVVGATYELRWTISGTNPPCPPTSDVVVITFVRNPTTANAGSDQSLCDTDITMLAGNTPAVGTGMWVIASSDPPGRPGSFSPSATEPMAIFRGIPGTTYTLKWTISNPPCMPSSDDVVITFGISPTRADAGPDQTICGTSTTLGGNSPTSGNGMWTAAGPGVATFVSATDHDTNVMVSIPGTYTFTWTISSRGCPPSTDNVSITFVAATCDFTFSPTTCLGDVIQFTDASSSTGGPIVSWNWSFGDASPSDIHGGLSTLTNPVYTYAATGTYTVTLTVTDANGCRATRTRDVTVRSADHVPPFCGFTIDANNNVEVLITDQDDAGTGGGIASINVLLNHNGTAPVFDRPLVPCVTRYIRITVGPLNPLFPANFMFEVKDCCGNTTVCDPVFFRAEASGTGRYEFKVSNMDRYLYVQNDGLSKIDIRINNRPLELLADPLRRNLHGNRQYMPWHGDIGVDVAAFMTEMENDVVIQVSGPANAGAMIVFADIEFPITSPAVLPQEFTLLQNYPNPFNPSTQIEYTVPASFTDGVKVELIIYNLIGQPVKTLENGFKTPNLYTVTWNGTDEFGRIVPTGIYLYRIKVGNFTAIKRMSLMK